MTEVRIDSISLPAGATLQLGGVDVTPAQVITVADINAGLLVFTPVPEANGAGYASFTFSVRDTGVPPGPLFDLAPNTMTVNVAPVNDLPIITSDGGGAAAAFVMAENTAGVTTVTATDIDLQPLAFSLAGVDAGQFSIDSVTGVLTFNPAPNFEAPGDAGSDNVYNVTVVVSDGAGGTDTQALTITVVDANDAPTAGDDAYVTDEDTPLAVAAAGVLANDGDEDGTPVTSVLVTGPANGAVVFNADGSFVYTPNANFFGVDTFTYQASDGALGSALATVTITVNPINDAPTAADGNVTIAAAYAFSVADFNYFDVDGDPLDRITITALPVEGQLLFDGLAVTLNQEVTAGEIAAGRLTYTPPTTSSATAASFGFSVSDGTLYEAASHTMVIGFASGAVTPPAPPAGAPDDHAAAGAAPRADARADGGRRADRARRWRRHQRRRPRRRQWRRRRRRAACSARPRRRSHAGRDRAGRGRGRRERGAAGRLGARRQRRIPVVRRRGQSEHRGAGAARRPARRAAGRRGEGRDGNGRGDGRAGGAPGARRDAGAGPGGRQGRSARRRLGVRGQHRPFGGLRPVAAARRRADREPLVVAAGVAPRRPAAGARQHGRPRGRRGRRFARGPGRQQRPAERAG